MISTGPTGSHSCRYLIPALFFLSSFFASQSRWIGTSQEEVQHTQEVMKEQIFEVIRLMIVKIIVTLCEVTTHKIGQMGGLL